MKTAIFVRGNARTWNYLKKDNIEFFNKIYNYPDWYVVIPDTGTVSRESLIEDFQGSNLISIQLPPDSYYPFNPVYNDDDFAHWEFYTQAYWRQAWLDYLAGIAKRKYELTNGIRYNNIVAIRPDNWFTLLNEPIERAQTELDPMAISNTNYSGELSFNDWVTPDFIWRAGSTAADIFSMRLLDTHYTSSIPRQAIHVKEHSLPPYYQAKNFIGGTRTLGHFQAQIITPNADFPWSGEKYNDNYYKVRWHELSIDERTRICVDMNINPRDYQLDTIKY